MELRVRVTPPITSIGLAGRSNREEADESKAPPFAVELFRRFAGPAVPDGRRETDHPRPRCEEEEDADAAATVDDDHHNGSVAGAGATLLFWEFAGHEAVCTCKSTDGVGTATNMLSNSRLFSRPTYGVAEEEDLAAVVAILPERYIFQPFCCCVALPFVAPLLKVLGSGYRLGNGLGRIIAALFFNEAAFRFISSLFFFICAARFLAEAAAAAAVLGFDRAAVLFFFLGLLLFDLFVDVVDFFFVQPLAPSSPPPPFRLRFKDFHRIFTAFSVRPRNMRAIRLHRLPSSFCAFQTILSSSSVQLPLLTLGSK